MKAMVVDVPSDQFLPVATLFAGTASFIVDCVVQNGCALVANEITKLRGKLTEWKYTKSSISWLYARKKISPEPLGAATLRNHR
jgi:hypothetical protein